MLVNKSVTCIIVLINEALHHDADGLDFASLDDTRDLPDFDFAVLGVALKDAGSRLADTDDFEQFIA